MISSINNLQKIIKLNFKNITYLFFILIFIDVYLWEFNATSLLIINRTNFLEYLGTAHFLIILFGTYVAGRITQFIWVLTKNRFNILGLEKNDLAYSNDNNLKTIALLTSVLIIYEIINYGQTQTLVNFLLSCNYFFSMGLGLAAIILFTFGLSHNNS